MNPRLLPLLVLLPLSLPTATPAAPLLAPQDLDALVGEEVARAQDRELDEIWGRVLELRDAERLGALGELDRSLDTYLARAGELEPKAALLLAATRLQGDKPDTQLISRALRPLFDDDELADGAATLLGDPMFRSLRGKDDLLEDMLSVADDTSRPPSTRLAFARGTYAIGGGSERRRARKTMRSFLESDDAELRAQGALALAAAGDEISGPLRRELERLERVPDERGALATAYLKLERVREHGDSKLRDLKRKYEEGTLPPELEEFVSVLNLVERRHLEGSKVSQQELVEAAIDGMLHWMDAHSSYLPSSAYAKFFQDLEAEYGGIGAYVNEDPDNGLFTIVRPIYSGPAYSAGLMTDDKVVRIDDWPTLGKPVDEIIKRLKGKPGTPVDLYIWRRGMDPELIDRPTEEMRVSVKRDLIEIPAGSYQMLPGNVGLIELNTFSQVAMEELERWIVRMKADGMQALVLDMRRNSGGLLSEAREVADLFLDADKVVVSTEGRDNQPEVLRTRREAVVPEDMPVVILTSRLTASAAEIVSGALQDHERADLVGKRTYGKGSVQQLLPILPQRQDDWLDENQNDRWDPWEELTRDWDDDGEVDYAPRVKLTIAKYRLPSGRSIHRELDREGNLVSEGGVEPDHVVELPLIDRWRFEELRRIRGSEELQDYVDDHWADNRELFGLLAVNDQKDPALYPDFDQLMMQLATSLKRNDVRRLLREEIRRRVQDDRGAEFPWGDFVEDQQVQKAIEIALSQLGKTPDDVTEFGLVFDIPTTEASPDVALVDPGLSRARDILERARDGGVILNEESLQELIELIGEAEKN